MTSPKSVHERLAGPMELSPVSEAVEASSRNLMIEALDYLYDTSGEPPAPTRAIVQRNAYSATEENDRDYFVSEMTKALGIDIDEALHRFELSHRGTEGSDFAELEPWMQGALGIAQQGSEKVYVRGATTRIARLNLREQPPLTLREVEFPIATRTDDASPQQSMARFMWFTRD